MWSLLLPADASRSEQKLLIACKLYSIGRAIYNVLGQNSYASSKADASKAISSAYHYTSVSSDGTACYKVTMQDDSPEQQRCLL